MGNAIKKVVLILVEGTTDKTVLQLGFSDYYLNDNVKVEIYPVRGDITICSANKNKPYNVKNGVVKIIKKFLDENKYRKTDILKVIEIIDIDGCYLNDDLIYEDNNYHQVSYSTKCIKIANKNCLLRRNENKRSNIEILVNTENIFDNLPYSIYFFSSNLENFFFNVFNCDHEAKTNYSSSKYELYKKNINNFYTDLNNNKTKSNSYISSWKELTQINDNIPRLSNLFIFFNKDK